MNYVSLSVDGYEYFSDRDAIKDIIRRLRQFEYLISHAVDSTCAGAVEQMLHRIAALEQRVTALEKRLSNHR
jgi:hypothetical protein